ncbi:potassium channel subfamily K member 18-like [Arapaima gigas]
MSLSVEGRRCPAERRRWCRWLWSALPHVSLISSLVVYGCIGALVFLHVESHGTFNATDGQYHDFLVRLVDLARPDNCSEECVIEKVDAHITAEFKSIWLQRPHRWNFFGSLFFCCTVFTTVGYGEMFPVTLPGKLFCIVYAMVGIPLMLLVITDVGDILAILLSKAYLHLHKLYKTSVSCCSFRRARKKRVEELIVHDRTYTFNKDVLIQQPADTNQIVYRQQLQNIFNHNKVQENLNKGLLQRSHSSPELYHMPLHKNTNRWGYPEIGEELDKLDVPMTVILLVVFAYILLMGLILPLWETGISHFDAFYFCFITLTTIGFGDIVPQHPKFFMLTSLFIISGMAIMSMAFKLSQSRIVSGYRKCMHCVSGGKMKKYDVSEHERVVNVISSIK